jgi:DNA-directed RNA polymerase I and III subunit RPAC2
MNFTGDPAKDVFKDACQNLMVMCQHVNSTFDKAVVDFKMSKSVDGMDIESNS